MLKFVKFDPRKAYNGQPPSHQPVQATWIVGRGRWWEFRWAYGKLIDAGHVALINEGSGFFRRKFVLTATAEAVGQFRALINDHVDHGAGGEPRTLPVWEYWLIFGLVAFAACTIFGSLMAQRLQAPY